MPAGGATSASPAPLPSGNAASATVCVANESRATTPRKWTNQLALPIARADGHGVGYLAAALVLLAVLLAGRQVPGWASAVPAAGAVIALAWRLEAERGRGRSIWLLATVGVALWSTGPLLGRESAWLAAAALLGQLVTAVALLRAARARGPERDPVGSLDGATVATGVTFPLLAWWGGPPLTQATITDPQLLLTLLSAPANLALLAIMLRYLAGRGEWTPAGVAMPAAVGIAVAADLSSIQASTPHLVQGLWAAACAACLLGAAHPSARDLFLPGHRSSAQRQRVRVMMLALMAALPMVVVLLGYINATPIDTVDMLLPLAATTGLVVARALVVSRRARSGWQGAALMSAAVVVIVLSGFVLIAQPSRASRRMLRGAPRSVGDCDAAGRCGRRGRADWPAAGSATPVDPAQQATRRAIRRLDVPQEAEIAALHASYLREAEVTLRGLGRNPTAAQLRAALARVLPARALLIGRVSELAEQYHGAAARSARGGRMASAGVLVAALCVLALLATRLTRFARRMESAEARSRADRASEARLRALLGASGDAVIVIGPDLRVLALGEQLPPLFGLPPDGAPQSLAEVLPPDECGRLQEALAALRERPGRSDRLTWTVPGADGVRHLEVFVVDHTGDEKIGGVVLSARDITDRVELEAALEHQATHDPLTGLPNRTYLAERLAHRLAHESAEPEPDRAQAIVLLDLDDFRAINDSVGHRVGDALLVELASRLDAVTVPGDLWHAWAATASHSWWMRLPTRWRPSPGGAPS